MRVSILFLFCALFMFFLNFLPETVWVGFIVIVQFISIQFNSILFEVSNHNKSYLKTLYRWCRSRPHSIIYKDPTIPVISIFLECAG